MKKKILFLNYLIWQPEDPGFRHKFEQLSRFYRGCILHLGRGKEVPAGDFKFCSLRWEINPLLRQFGYSVFCLCQAHKKGPFDAIVSYDPLFCGIVGIFIKAMTGAKLLVEVNTDHFWTMSNADMGLREKINNAIKKAFMHLTFYFADGVKCINIPLTEKYSQKFRLDKKNIPVRTFFSFIGTHAFRKTDSNSNGPILCVGHPYNVKGIDVLLKAFGLITSKYPKARLKIIGHCEDRKPYEKLAAGNPNISFQNGMFFNEIVSEFENCYFLVLPSRTEGIPRVLVEAMACGKAVIGSRVGGIPEVIEDKKTGLLFESENFEELAEKMGTLLDNPTLIESMGEAGYEKAKKYFSPKRYAELYHDFLESVMRGKKDGQ